MPSASAPEKTARERSKAVSFKKTKNAGFPKGIRRFFFGSGTPLLNFIKQLEAIVNIGHTLWVKKGKRNSMKYRRALTGAVLVPTFIFLSGIGLVDDAQAGSIKAKHSGSSKKSSAKSSSMKFGGFEGGTTFKNNFAKVGTDFKPGEIEQPAIESPASVNGGSMTSGSKKASARSGSSQCSKK
jgi:hypothetical protein